VRTESVGTEASSSAAYSDARIPEIIKELKLRPRLPSKSETIVARYIDDMSRAIHEVARVLKPKGKAVYVIGENTVRGTYIRNSVIVSAVAEACGLRLCERRERDLPASRRYLPPPALRGADPMDARMRREVVLSFTKWAA
jgi:hypothetical protein